MSLRLLLRLTGSLLLLAATCAAQPVDPALELARARDPGIVTLIRHARAPGTGDPPGFTLGDCSTQRNLSEAGRMQATQLGKALRAVGVRDADVRSSQWCRCLDTARLLDVGQVGEDDYLNSFFRQGDEADATLRLRRAVLAKLNSRRPLLLITHQVNITALTGVTPAEGEVVFVRATAAGTIEVVGRAALP
jgi:phosphohistidine phosphatase SixA